MCRVREKSNTVKCIPWGNQGQRRGERFSVTITKAHVVLIVQLGLVRVEPPLWAELVDVGTVDVLVSVDKPWITSNSQALSQPSQSTEG